MTQDYEMLLPVWAGVLSGNVYTSLFFGHVTSWLPLAHEQLTLSIDPPLLRLWATSGLFLVIRSIPSLCILMCCRLMAQMSVFQSQRFLPNLPRFSFKSSTFHGCLLSSYTLSRPISANNFTGKLRIWYMFVVPPPQSDKCPCVMLIICPCQT